MCPSIACRYLVTGHVPGPTQGARSGDFLLDGVSSRYVPNYVYAAEGASLVVPARSPYFANESLPRAVLDMRMFNTLGESEPNAQYVLCAMHYDHRRGRGCCVVLAVCICIHPSIHPSMHARHTWLFRRYNVNIVGLTVRIGEGNAGAIGFCLRAAQGSGLEDVTVVFEGGSAADAGLAGIAGWCGVAWRVVSFVRRWFILCLLDKYKYPS